MDESEFLHHEPCPKCGSSDNLARYSDGHAHCFGCSYYEKGDGSISEPQTTPKYNTIDAGSVAYWSSRKINMETAEKFGFTRTTFDGEPVRVFNYRNSSHQIVAQKLRFRKKSDGKKPFKFLGDTANCGLFGSHLWRDGGRRIVITEGEIDAMSLSQVQGNKWPVVSIPNGVQGAKKSLKKNLEWLAKFDEVVLMFDMDEPGQTAAKECMNLFEPGKCKVATLPLKDPNEMLVAGRVKELIDAVWAAKIIRPDGIMAGTEMFDIVNRNDDVLSTNLPFEKLQELTRGVRRGELWTLTAGSGIGKSAVVREITHHLLTVGDTIGVMMLEEDSRRTGLGLMGIAANKPLHLDKNLASAEEFQDAFDRTLGTGRLFLYDHFGSTEVDNLMAKIRYLAKGCDCKWIVLDHLSIVISGQEDGDERRMIDNAMTHLKKIAVECNVGIFIVSHLKRPSGDKGHENGAETSLAQLRGSHAIAQLSDFVIGMERNQQANASFTYEGKEYTSNNITTLRVLKNRFTGETGPAGWLLFDKDTGRLIELLEDPDTMIGDPDDDEPYEEGSF